MRVACLSAKQTVACGEKETENIKIVMIHGQNHRGTTWHMGRILADKLAEKEDIIEFFLPRDLNHFCLGCYSCIEDETKCPFIRGYTYARIEIC